MAASTDRSTDVAQQALADAIDYAVPRLAYLEALIYLYLLRQTIGLDGTRRRLFGSGSISVAIRGSESASGGSTAAVRRHLRTLDARGFISLLETSPRGTMIEVHAPRQVPEILAMLQEPDSEPDLDWYADPALRQRLFERDSWACRYCGTALLESTATLDHRVPTVKGGTSSPDNLASCCHRCNSVKGGRTYEDAALDLLADIRNRGRSSSSQ